MASFMLSMDDGEAGKVGVLSVPAGHTFVFE